MLKCRACDRTYKDDCSLWRCNCGGYLTYFREKPLEISRESITSGPLSMWRYRSVIPVGPEVITMGEGLTPLVRADIGTGEVFLKMDYLCPTGSYKDRGISVLTTKLRENGINSLIEDSSGNAGASMASYCARGGLSCRIFVPHYTSAGKCVQIESAGAELVKVPGTREDTSAAAMGEGRSTFYGSHNWSPWFVEGVKTFAYEIWEQMGWSVPDNLVVPLGQGSLVLGAYRAFSELLEAGLIDRMPKLHGVQAENCAPIARAYERGLDSPVGID
ncbi:MAG: pyridoxal-phosphate dependent enzyme, partial [Synergistales bacterium]|nr:pyridoxal-phosphate dependent enzyme [Synergistales bacterium]